jgi:hypothetical protein
MILAEAGACAVRAGHAVTDFATLHVFGSRVRMPGRRVRPRTVDNVDFRPRVSVGARALDVIVVIRLRLGLKTTYQRRS